MCPRKIVSYLCVCVQTSASVCVYVFRTSPSVVWKVNMTLLANWAARYSPITALDDCHREQIGKEGAVNECWEGYGRKTMEPEQQANKTSRSGCHIAVAYRWCEGDTCQTRVMCCILIFRSLFLWTVLHWHMTSWCPSCARSHFVLLSIKEYSLWANKPAFLLAEKVDAIFKENLWLFCLWLLNLAQ